MSKHLARIAQFLQKLFISPFEMNKERNVLKRLGSADAIYSKPPKISNTSAEGLFRVKKKMYAVLMMYSGWGYYGMQRSPTHPTIEGELSQALISCGYLEDMTGEAFKKIWFQRASKTDKSVSATGQVCSMLLPASDDLMQNLNAALPKHIRILGKLTKFLMFHMLVLPSTDIIRATQSFCANTACSHRVYDYLFPTFALAPHDLAGGDTAHWCFRVSAETLTHANAVLHRFKGTHNFYNFTSGRLAADKSCYRYIISMECMPPFLYADSQYAVIRVVGQSFMLHQIRKMIGLMFAVVRGNTTDDVFDHVFGTERIDVPKAPGLGLMLNQVVYTRYNEKFGHDGIHLPIDWTKYEFSRHDAFVTHVPVPGCFILLLYVSSHKFYSYHTFSLSILTNPLRCFSMLGWLDSLNVHSYTFRAPSCPTMDRSNLPSETAASPLLVPTDDPPSEQTSLTESNQTISEPTQVVMQS
ncbi:tRNA pseudouridine synthase [Paragonimus heterotremus]|uniref:Pseudouridylate synthase 1 homolog n=1 Tax=Paragonimus heterotremus TaxID=100268 RepID=A0A8J4SNU9_9TREM|nr:tRNA pseudouridine synthase [Paragonimus heterotremus]